MRAVLRHERDLLDVKARLGHRVAGLDPHGGKRPEALDAGMDEMGEVDDLRTPRASTIALRVMAGSPEGEAVVVCIFTVFSDGLSD